MTLRHWISALAVAGLLFGASAALAAEKKPLREPDAFGSLQTPSLEQARSQAQDWLKATGKMDDATQKAFAEIWDQPDRPVLNRVTDTLALGNADAAKLLDEARDPGTAAPKVVPSLIKDTKLPAYFRGNLALAYAKALSNRRVYEEALDALAVVRPEQVVDPSAYFFHRAVAEHALIRKNDAIRSIARLLDDVTDAPDRYRLVALLMFVDMQSWKEKDLDWIARKMDNIERRLELARGGPQTQKIQREVVARLDEIIKELENRKKGS